MSIRTRIKVCGMTDMIEAKGAVDAGVDALGFIFSPQSPRMIDPDRAREIIRVLPPYVDAVGVFVDEQVEVVNEIVKYCGLTIAQLHGSETVDYCSNIDGRTIKSFRIRSNGDLSGIESYGGVVSGILLDTYHEKKAGGTGESFDWRLLEGKDFAIPIILAGGLFPENVYDAIEQVRPFAVDVNSGVEYEPGRKSLEKLKKFIREVNRADKELNASVGAGDDS